MAQSSNGQIEQLKAMILAYAPVEADEVVAEVAFRSCHCVKDYVGILYDGLAYGNWPWELARSNPVKEN